MPNPSRCKIGKSLLLAAETGRDRWRQPFMRPATRPPRIGIHLVSMVPIPRPQWHASLPRPTKAGHIPIILGVAIAGIKKRDAIIPVRHGHVADFCPCPRACWHHGARLRTRARKSIAWLGRRGVGAPLVLGKELYLPGSWRCCDGLCG